MGVPSKLGEILYSLFQNFLLYCYLRYYLQYDL